MSKLPLNKIDRTNLNLPTNSNKVKENSNSINEPKERKEIC